jgi:VanZ family protein
MKSTATKYGFALGWAAFVLFATIINTKTLEKLSLQDLFAYDKPIHMVLFGIQAWLLIRARQSTAYRYHNVVVFWCCVASALYGLLTEVLQGLLTTSRTFDYYDFIADSIGCLIVGLWLMRKKVSP